MLNRQGDTVSAQISEMGAVTFLEVNLWGMPRGQYVTTRFETGWNPEIINEIKPTSAPALLWGN